MLFSAVANTTPATNVEENNTSNNLTVSPPAASTSNAASTSANNTHDSNADSARDSNKPPDYEEALAYRKSEMLKDEGYPEPSLVDGPQPPSYDAVY